MKYQTLTEGLTSYRECLNDRSLKPIFSCNETHICVWPESCQVLALPTQLPHEMWVIPTAACTDCWGGPSWGDSRCKHRTGAPLLGRQAAPCLRVLPLPRFPPPPSKGLGICTLPLALLFSIGTAGWLANSKVWSYQVLCVLETRNSQNLKRSRGTTGKRNQIDKSPSRARKKRIQKNWNWLQKIWKATENGLGVWYLSICSKLHRWSHGSHRMKWRDERKQFMKLLQLAVGL